MIRHQLSRMWSTIVNIVVAVLVLTVFTACETIRTVVEDERTANEQTTNNGDELCSEWTPMVKVDSSTANRTQCDQDGNRRRKVESTRFASTFKENDRLHIVHARLVEKNYYYAHRDESLPAALRKTFNFNDDVTFNPSGEDSVGLGGSVTYITFSIRNDQCFGFARNRREKSTRGYYCKPDSEQFTKQDIETALNAMYFK